MTNSSDRGRAPSGRAASLEAMGAVLGAMFTPEGTRKGLELKLRPTDIVIAPFTKSGTTWLQQIAHTLRTRGDMQNAADVGRAEPPDRPFFRGDHAGGSRQKRSKRGLYHINGKCGANSVPWPRAFKAAGKGGKQSSLPARRFFP